MEQPKTIIGGPEIGCILPPFEIKKIKANENILKTLELWLNKPRYYIIEALETRNTEETNDTRELIGAAGKLYHGYLPKKKREGDKTRMLKEPYGNLKDIQRSLLTHLKQVPISPISTATKYKDNNRKNASKHKNNPYLITVDIKDAFPSVTTNRIFKNIQGSLFKHLSLKAPFLQNKEEKNLFLRAITHLIVHANSLPQGAPTSPVTMNIVLTKTNAQLLKLLDEFPVRKPVITQYVDDYAVSFQSQYHEIAELKKEIEYLWGGHGDGWKLYKQLFDIRKEMKMNRAIQKKYSKFYDNIKKPANQDMVTELLKDSLEKTKILIKTALAKQHITNEHDQKKIPQELEEIKTQITAYTQKYAKCCLQGEREEEILNIGEEVENMLNVEAIQYPRQTIGDVKESVIKELYKNGFKINPKKTKTRFPGKPYHRAVTKVAIDHENNIVPTKKLQASYQNIFEDLKELSILELIRHPYYKKKFLFKELDYIASGVTGTESDFKWRSRIGPNGMREGLDTKIIPRIKSVLKGQLSYLKYIYGDEETIRYQQLYLTYEEIIGRLETFDAKAWTERLLLDSNKKYREYKKYIESMEKKRKERDQGENNEGSDNIDDDMPF